MFQVLAISGLHEVENPTHGSGWILRILSTEILPNTRTIPPTGVGGLFRSSLAV